MGELILVATGQRLEEIPDPAPDTEQQAVVNLESARLQRELRALPALEEKVLRWRFGLNGTGEELSVRQVARRLNVSTGTAWSIEQRALAMLRASFGVPAAA